jgi:hypothetical protein
MHRRFVLKLAVSLLLISLWLMVPWFASAEPMAAVPDNHPLIELPTTPAPQDMQLHMTARFKVRNQEERERLTKEHADPSSPEYRHEWTPEEFHRHFGALPADFHMVEHWLLSKALP